MTLYAVVCSYTASCGWQGNRRAESMREALKKPCPNCGAHVRRPREANRG